MVKQLIIESCRNCEYSIYPKLISKIDDYCCHVDLHTGVKEHIDNKTIHPDCPLEDAVDIQDIIAPVVEVLARHDRNEIVSRTDFVLAIKETLRLAGEK